jgi:hypothetical protein
MCAPAKKREKIRRFSGRNIMLAVAQRSTKADAPLAENVIVHRPCCKPVLEVLKNFNTLTAATAVPNFPGTHLPSPGNAREGEISRDQPGWRGEMATLRAMTRQHVFEVAALTHLIPGLVSRGFTGPAIGARFFAKSRNDLGESVEHAVDFLARGESAEAETN